MSAEAAGTTTTTAADVTTGPSQFQINFSVINNAGDVKTNVSSTRDFVNGQKVGGQIGNTMQAITGSTFDSGNFKIEVSDITPPSRRQLETTLVFRDSSGAILDRTSSTALAGHVVLNGTFVDDIFTTGDTGIALQVNDNITIQGINPDGSTFQTIFTITNTPADDTSLSDGKVMTMKGLIEELNCRDRTLGVNGPTVQSSFRNSVITFTGNGTFSLIDDVADHSKSSFFMTVDDKNTTRTLTDRSELKIDGNPKWRLFPLMAGRANGYRLAIQ